MSEPRVIKKYPNRRLYDTVESRYITLADVRRLVMERIDFVVIDKKTQADITHAILLQVIAEQESHSPPLLSRDFLTQVIRSHAEQAQGVLSSYLEQAMRLFTSQQHELRERIRQVTGPDTLNAVAGFAERNFQRWRSVQDEIFRTLHGALTSAARPRPENGEPERRQDSTRSGS
ncbi:MAG: polyhydroxyalkanoate synthesis repressor PhaR [Steroidobacteraceae bacterium]